MKSLLMRAEAFDPAPNFFTKVGQGIRSTKWWWGLNSDGTFDLLSGTDRNNFHPSFSFRLFAGNLLRKCLGLRD
jgi:hypothetical protein